MPPSPRGFLRTAGLFLAAPSPKATGPSFRHAPAAPAAAQWAAAIGRPAAVLAGAAASAGAPESLSGPTPQQQEQIAARGSGTGGARRPGRGRGDRGGVAAEVAMAYEQVVPTGAQLSLCYIAFPPSSCRGPMCSSGWPSWTSWPPGPPGPAVVEKAALRWSRISPGCRCSRPASPHHGRSLEVGAATREAVRVLVELLRGRRAGVMRGPQQRLVAVILMLWTTWRYVDVSHPPRLYPLRRPLPGRGHHRSCGPTPTATCYTAVPREPTPPPTRAGPPCVPAGTTWTTPACSRTRTPTLSSPCAGSTRSHRGPGRRRGAGPAVGEEITIALPRPSPTSNATWPPATSPCRPNTRPRGAAGQAAALEEMAGRGDLDPAPWSWPARRWPATSSGWPVPGRPGARRAGRDRRRPHLHRGGQNPGRTAVGKSIGRTAPSSEGQ